MSSNRSILQDVQCDFTLRISDDERMSSLHPVSDGRQDDTLRLTTTGTAKRENTACNIFAAEAEFTCSQIESAFVLSPECTEQG